jgi:dihydroflavonol-4-reductase
MKPVNNIVKLGADELSISPRKSLRINNWQGLSCVKTCSPLNRKFFSLKCGGAMKVFITGATGFIGGYVMQELAAAGHMLHCLVWDKEKNPADKLKQFRAKWVVGDVTDQALLAQAMQGCDAVVHLAGLYTMWEPDPGLYTHVNVKGTRAVMAAALQAGVSKAIDVSTYAIYNRSDQTPFDEHSQPVLPQASEYARTKYLGELEAWKLYEQGLPLVMIYPCNVMGAGDTRPTGSYLDYLITGRLPATMFNHSVLTFVHVRDVALAICRALEKPGNIGEKYIIGDERLKVAEVNRLIASCAGVKTPLLSLPDPLAMASAGLLTALANWTKRPPLWGLSVDYGRTVRKGLNATGVKAARELGIRYTPVCEAIRESVAWYRNHYK